MKPGILKAMLDQLDADLQPLMPDTTDDDFGDAFVHLVMIQYLRNTRNVSNPIITRNEEKP